MPHQVSFVYVDQLAKSGDKEAQQLLEPKKGSDLAAGLDLVAANLEPIAIASGAHALVPTGIALALPPGFEAQVRPRSGLALKHGVTVLNSPGTIDADYRGEVGVILINHGKNEFVVERGMRVAQMVIAKLAEITMQSAAELPSTERGAGGFGSTGMAAVQ